MYKKLIKGDYVGMDITGEGSGGSFTRPSSLTIKNATVKDFKKTNGWALQYIMTAFISYNIFGRQNWGTDFGEMSLNSYLQINFRNGGRTGVGFQLRPFKTIYSWIVLKIV